MKNPHKHAELIKAWADGAEIEIKFYDGWRECRPIDWNENAEFRIKPEPKPDFVYYGKLDEPVRGGYSLGSCFTTYHAAGDKVKLTFDGETGKLKSAEVI